MGGLYWRDRQKTKLIKEIKHEIWKQEGMNPKNKYLIDQLKNRLKKAKRI